MKRVLVLGLVAACEIQPAPKQQAAPSPPPTQEQAAKPVEPAGAPADAGAADAPVKIEITTACLTVASKVAQVFIDSATDPAQKSIYEQERANMTRKTGEACTVQAWSENAHNCYLASKTPVDIKACETKFPGRPPRPTPGGIQPPNP
ncbi:MAG TPA: hypothetical protein VIV11_05130 [Kofleriaceae bacterium]